ncbi:nicotinate (nicotinamide) nucleotide adenylyltransferase [Myxococcota bacterium]|nr:nicotinate (nicotinamide) nucleotide adenylyltransferase [Myxococcota bacterium]
MKIGVYGGSFNPPHVGHGMVAAWLLWTERVEEVWLLPAFAHAFDKELAPFDERVAWCEALAGELGPRVKVCAVEAELPPPSYTVNTLTTLAARHPEHEFRLVLGADNLSTLHLWRRWDELAARFSPIFVGRVGYPEIEGAVSFPAVSSTEIRARLAAGEPIDHLVPAAVRRAMAGPRGGETS